MILTLDKLKELRACQAGIDWFANQKETELRAVCFALLHSKKSPWVNWLLAQLMTHKQRVKWSVLSAREVLHIFETKFPGDDRPRKAIEAAEAWFTDPGYRNKAADAAAAADAADAAAAYAAAAAADAAAYAAADAAAAAADAADAADAAADAAAADAAAADAADARKNICIKITNYALDLIEGDA